ncbi:hypothetical protein GE107_18255 [Cohnella sp. CFH 77786]|uniref:hypothetical protein n=1 Tax=Cohnella sp. CFH 77786 TaxID=2662265 RepID=UPI001C608ABA|nr:hypothetical protein [Cohnella sp. CFH 77786]MBW5448002.1 hypothetical protein [Cohnella sp. CFH 77786]
MNTRTLMGIGLLAVGGLMLYFGRGEAIGTGTMIGYLWPSLFVIPLGLFFHWMYFSMLERRGAGLLIPGGVLVTAGLVCQFAMLTDGWGYMWPGFIFAPAVGLFEFYFFGNRNKWLLIPINILTVLSVLFFLVFSIGTLINRFTGQPIMAMLLILVGVILLVGWKRKAV